MHSIFYLRCFLIVGVLGVLVPKNGYENETVANDCVRDYIYKYYNSVRPHSHNLGLSPNEKEAFYWKTFNWLARKG